MNEKYPSLPLPTNWSEKSQLNLNKKEGYLYNPNDGWIKISSHPCTKCYELAKPYIKKFDLAIDIGCRFGEFTCACENDFEKTIGFDPKRHLAFNFNTNDEKTIHFKCAIGERYETIKMFSGSHPGTLINGKPMRFLKSTKHLAQSIPLDYFDFDASEIGLIKIDIEGFELKALKGAVKTISKHKPVIIIEQNKVQLASECKNAALAYLLSNGYRVAVANRDMLGKITDYILIPS